MDDYLNGQSKLLACDHKQEAAQVVASAGEPTETAFARRLLSTARELFESEKLSDMTVILDGRKIPCHRFVFVARSDYWSVNNLAKVSTLEFEGLPYDTGHTLLKWVYTDEVDVKLGDWMILDLVHAAKRFNLHQLIQRCERLLISSLNVNNCVKFYKCALDLNAEKLLETTSHYIVSLLGNIPRESFDQLGSAALHGLLESKFKFPLHAAISLRREDVVRLCVNEHSDRLLSRLAEPNEKGDIPLQMALESRQDSIAQCLVDSGADVDSKTLQGVPLIIDFLKRGDYESCSFLTANAACLNCVDPMELRNGLHILAAGCLSSLNGQGSCEGLAPYANLVRRFLAGDVPVNAVDREHNTPLHLAVLSRNAVFFNSIVKLSSLNFDLLNDQGLPALWYALDCPDGSDNFAFAEELISRGANFNSIRPKTGDTLLSMCVKNDLTSAALYLVDKGASVDVPNAEGETALYLACSSGIVDLVAVLLGHGANPNVQRKGDNETPLLVAIRRRHFAAVDVLLKDRKEGSCRLPLLFELVDARGDNALSLAINSGLYQVADKLMSAGCSVNSKDANGDLLLTKFIEEANSDACLYLIHHGCEINEKAANYPAPLIHAVEKHLPQVVEALCKAGVDTTATNDDGDSALWVALCLQMEDVAAILVKSGMSVDAWVPGPSGCLQTLLHKAIDENNQSAACFLIQKYVVGRLNCLRNLHCLRLLQRKVEYSLTIASSRRLRFISRVAVPKASG
uniref:BTB domain-containing protein n=1 Tax=Trichuris muris TaxID=70415 RepID=A0A5S6QC69_TRIMR